MSTRSYWVYILANKIGGTLYIGVTNDLVRRVFEHKSKFVDGFTQKYDVARLVHFEQFDDIEFAIRREKRLKKWTREWKIQLIEKDNPNWDDLYPRRAVPRVLDRPLFANDDTERAVRACAHKLRRCLLGRPVKPGDDSRATPPAGSPAPFRARRR